MQSPSSPSVKVLLTNKLAKFVMCLIRRVGSVPDFKSEKDGSFFHYSLNYLKKYFKSSKILTLYT